MDNKCARCGSEKIIPQVPLMDHYGDTGVFSKDTSVEIHGEPSAWFFKDSSLGKISLDICGDCGHAEIFVSNHRDLYEKYQKSQQR